LSSEHGGGAAATVPPAGGRVVPVTIGGAEPATEGPPADPEGADVVGPGPAPPAEAEADAEPAAEDAGPAGSRVQAPAANTHNRPAQLSRSP
jgi:hypothetical protein